MARLSLTLLGSFNAKLDGEPAADFDSNKVRALLAYLAVESDRVHRRESLATLLYPGYPDRSARTNLRNALYNLRTVIGDREADPPFLHISRATLQFNRDSDVWLDVTALKRAATHADAVPVDELTEAADLYAGDFLAGFTLEDAVGFDDWASVTRERLRRQTLDLLGILVDQLTAEGDHDQAVTYARRRVELEPWLEDAQRELIRLLAATGQRSAALRQYRRCVRVLEEELGAEPAAETTAQYNEIRATESPGRPGIKAAPVAAVPSPPPPQRPTFLDEDAEPVVTERPIFVGREPELARLGGYLDAALEGRGQVAFIVGGPGRGKTALMRAFQEQALAKHPSLLVINGACNATVGVGDAYLPFREALGMLTGDAEARWRAGLVSRDHADRLWSAMPVTLPALVRHGPYVIETLVRGADVISRAESAGLAEAAWMSELHTLAQRIEVSGLQQQALFQQVTNTLQAVARTHPLVLLLDDLQWADLGSIGLLLHLGRRLTGSPILIVGAYRPEEVATLRNDGQAPHPLTKVLQELKRQYGDAGIDLRAADETDGAQFVDALLATEPNRLTKAFSASLYDRTGGHPLFTVELLRAMQAQGSLQRTADGAWVADKRLDWDMLPVRVEAVIAERLSRLTPQQRDLLVVASVEGDIFTAQVVAEVQELDERTVLQTLAQDLGDQHRLVREQDEITVDGRYLTQFAFVHALFREHLYHEMSHGVRRLLHGEVAETLEALCGKKNERIVPQLAQHFDRAGRTEKAITYSIRAGEQARQVYANQQALGYFERALALLQRLKPTDAIHAWHQRTLSELGKLCFCAGKVPDAEHYLREAITLGKRLDLDTQKMAVLYHWLSESLFWQGKYDEILPIGEEALAFIGDDQASLAAALANGVGAAGYFRKDPPRCEALVRQTARFIQDLPYIEELRPLYTYMIIRCRHYNDRVEYEYWLRALEQRARDHGDLIAMATVHYEATILMISLGDLEQAVKKAHLALITIKKTGDIKHESWIHGHLTHLHLSAGRLRKATTCARHALDLSRKVGFTRDIADYHETIGEIALSGQDWKRAIEVITRAESIYDATADPCDLARLNYLRGRAHLLGSDGDRARQDFEASLRCFAERDRDWHPSWMSRFLATLLSGLDEATDDLETFKAIVQSLREQNDSLDGWVTQWSLEPADAVANPRLLSADDIQPTSTDWAWHDPFGDCRYRLETDLVIQAANARSLWRMNVSAARWLRLLPTNVKALQATCESVLEDRPAIGGLLLWRNEEDYLWLEVGHFGYRDVAFGGCLDNQDRVIGRGRLPEGAEPGWALGEPVTLRLEVTGDRVDALCTLDEEEWFSVGHATFPVGDDVLMGVHAIGMIDRTIYHGAYPEGTAIRFTSFKVWGS